MRIKAIPAEALNYGEHHPWIVAGGVALLAVGAYYYYHNHNLVDYYNADPTASTAIPFSYSMPQVMGGGGGGTGAVDGATNPLPAQQAAQSALDLQWAAFHLEETKVGNEYDIAKKSLQAQLNIAHANQDIALAGISASNWATSAGLAEAFLVSGQQFFTGDVAGQSFAFLGTGAPRIGKSAVSLTQLDMANFEKLLGSSTIQGYLGGTQSASGTLSTSPYGGYPSGSPSQSSGSYSAPSTYAGTYSGSTSGTTSNTAGYTGANSSFGERSLVSNV